MSCRSRSGRLTCKVRFAIPTHNAGTHVPAFFLGGWCTKHDMLLK